MKKITLEDLKSLDGGAQKKSAKEKFNETWKTGSGSELSRGERQSETLSSSITRPAPRKLRK